MCQTRLFAKISNSGQLYTQNIFAITIKMFVVNDEVKLITIHTILFKIIFNIIVLLEK